MKTININGTNFMPESEHGKRETTSHVVVLAPVHDHRLVSRRDALIKIIMPFTVFSMAKASER
jgi:hypothetical protein